VTSLLIFAKLHWEKTKTPNIEAASSKEDQKRRLEVNQDAIFLDHGPLPKAKGEETPNPNQQERRLRKKGEEAKIHRYSTQEQRNIAQAAIKKSQIEAKKTGGRKTSGRS